MLSPTVSLLALTLIIEFKADMLISSGVCNKQALVTIGNSLLELEPIRVALVIGLYSCEIKALRRLGNKQPKALLHVSGR